MRVPEIFPPPTHPLETRIVPVTDAPACVRSAVKLAPRPMLEVSVPFQWPVTSTSVVEVEVEAVVDEEPPEQANRKRVKKKLRMPGEWGQAGRFMVKLRVGRGFRFVRRRTLSR